MDYKSRLIEKLFEDTCSSEELLLLLELIRDDEDAGAPEILKLLQERISRPSLPDQEISNRIKDKIFSRIQPEVRQITAPGKHPAMPMFSLMRLVAVAATLLLVFAGAWLYFYQNGDGETMIVSTAYGETKSFVLPDGSAVTLNANSTLRYNQFWADNTSRQVWLEGEAFFEVAKKTATGQKFRVSTSDLTVEVLGTIFNVNTYRDATSVFLEEGKVQLELLGQEIPLMMAPGEIVSYSKTTGALPEKLQTQPISHTSWKDGIMVFNQTPLEEVLTKMEETYGIVFEVADANYLKLQITTGLPVENAALALSLLEATLGTKITAQEGYFRIE
jgi:ferric-dicitrate binding protein FerR (iron transport regulator)